MKYLICGLGNPGIEYANTRHNIGFLVLDALAKAEGVSFEEGRYGWKTEFRLKGRTLILLKPNTYMNLSGKALGYWVSKEKIPADKLMVIADDIALPFGTLRMRTRGSDGGHNGLKSIQETLGNDQYARIRFGVGNDFPKGAQAKYVLSDWSEAESLKLPERIELALSMIRSFATIGAALTMTQFNNK